MVPFQWKSPLSFFVTALWFFRKHAPTKMKAASPRPRASPRRAWVATRTNFITVDRAKEDAEDERDRRCASALASPRVEGTQRPGECAGPWVAACTVTARIWPRVSCFVLPSMLLVAQVLRFWLGLLHSIALGLVSRLAPMGLFLRAACPPAR